MRAKLPKIPYCDLIHKFSPGPKRARQPFPARCSCGFQTPVFLVYSHGRKMARTWRSGIFIARPCSKNTCFRNGLMLRTVCCQPSMGWISKSSTGSFGVEAVSIRAGDRLAPFYWPAMIALQHDTRAMDIHCFLTHRLRPCNWVTHALLPVPGFIRFLRRRQRVGRVSDERQLFG